jgi:hypothetical protein
VDSDSNGWRLKDILLWISTDDKVTLSVDRGFSTGTDKTHAGPVMRASGKETQLQVSEYLLRKLRKPE